MFFSRAFLFFSLALLLLPLLWPEVDVLISRAFFHHEMQAGTHFPIAAMGWAEGLHQFIQLLARGLGVFFIVALGITAIRRRPFCQLHLRQWAFLLCSLVLLPGVLTNLVLKDQWDRARPREIIEFGGTAHFTPALLPANECADNCSFVSGDASLGFWLAAFAFVLRGRFRARALWLGVYAGTGFGMLRIMMGAHFFSDVVYAGAFMLGGLFLLARLFFGKSETDLNLPIDKIKTPQRL